MDKHALKRAFSLVMSVMVFASMLVITTGDVSAASKTYKMPVRYTVTDYYRGGGSDTRTVAMKYDKFGNVTKWGTKRFKIKYANKKGAIDSVTIPGSTGTVKKIYYKGRVDFATCRNDSAYAEKDYYYNSKGLICKWDNWGDAGTYTSRAGLKYNKRKQLSCVKINYGEYAVQTLYNSAGLPAYVKYKAPSYYGLPGSKSIKYAKRKGAVVKATITYKGGYIKKTVITYKYGAAKTMKKSTYMTVMDALTADGNLIHVIGNNSLSGDAEQFIITM